MNEEFEQKIIEKIKEQLGDLLTDSDYRKLIEKGIQQIFFDRVNMGYNSYRDGIFIETIKKEVDTKIREEIRLYIENHPEEVNKVIQETLEKGMYGMMVSYMENQFSGPLMMLKDQLKLKGLIQW